MNTEKDLQESTEQVLTTPAAVGQRGQLKCRCKNAKFTRTVDADFNCLCGGCGKAL